MQYSSSWISYLDLEYKLDQVLGGPSQKLNPNLMNSFAVVIVDTAEKNFGKDHTMYDIRIVIN